MTQHFTESDKDAPWNGFFGLEIVVMAEQTSRRASPRTMDAMCFRSRFHDWQTHTTHPCSCFLFEVCIEMERQLRIGAHALKHSCFSVRGVWWCDPRRGGNCKFEVLCNYIHSDARWCDPHSLLLPGGIDLRASLWAAQTAGTCACLAPMRNSFVVFVRSMILTLKTPPTSRARTAALNFSLADAQLLQHAGVDW